MATITNIPEKTQLILRVGSTLTLEGTITAAGEAMDLTGCTIEGLLGDTTLEGTVTSALLGTFTLVITPDMIPAASATTWSLDLVDSLGAVTPILGGVAIVR